MTRIIQVPNVTDEIERALYEGYTQFIMVVGEKNLGKSSLCLQILYGVYERYCKDWEQTWYRVFHHLTFTPKQFYGFYIKVKDKIDQALLEAGLDQNVLEADIEDDWEQVINSVLESPVNNTTFFKDIREKYRMPAILIDDLGAHMNRQDVSIYYDKFFQQLFADFTLVRPYIACILGTAPDINNIPRMVIDHVTGIIQCDKQGHAIFRKKKKYIRFKGKTIESYMKLYDGDEITWTELDSNIYSKYEIFRHLLSRKVSDKAIRALQKTSEAEEKLLA